MADSDILTHSPLILRPDPSRTVIRPFSPEDPAEFAVAGHPRPQRIADRVLALDAAGVAELLELLIAPLAERHRDAEAILVRRFAELQPALARDGIDRDRALLIGAYFCEEYSFEAAALFNPSIVLDPDQSGLPAGTIRFVMSLRGIGEGHVSSITFRSGTWGPNNDVAVDVPGAQGIAPRIQRTTGEGAAAAVHLGCAGSREISETVIFPVTPSQHQGVEDLRLVRFVEDDGTVEYVGTYTAFSGAATRIEMLHLHDFQSFDMVPLTGGCVENKGMALFPRRIGGRYAMLGRLDNENLWLMQSDDLHHWDEATRFIRPQYPWEFVQIGNCGSPIEIDEGWLVLTHGVGMVRSYCIGATLLDKADPSKILARTPRPILMPSPEERGGYVPNVVYSCGGLVHDRTLLLPYGVADQFTTFASVALEKLLAAME